MPACWWGYGHDMPAAVAAIDGSPSASDLNDFSAMYSVSGPAMFDWLDQLTVGGSIYRAAAAKHTVSFLVCFPFPPPP